MQSTVKNVNDYLNEVPIERKTTITKLRKLCLELLVDFEESMVYGMPSYSRNGEVEVAFASQKNHISLYILRTDVMNVYRDSLNTKGVSLGKGCIRYSKPERIDFKLVEKMLDATQESTGVIC